MNRAIVLLVCLSAAAAIVAYSHPFNNASDRAAVVTVTQRAPEPVVRGPVTTAAQGHRNAGRPRLHRARVAA